MNGVEKCVNYKTTKEVEYVNEWGKAREREKAQIVAKLETYGLTVCRPEEKCLEELRAVLSVFEKGKIKGAGAFDR